MVAKQLIFVPWNMSLCCNGKYYANPCLAEADGIYEPAEESDQCELTECGSQAICTTEI